MSFDAFVRKVAHGFESGVDRQQVLRARWVPYFANRPGPILDIGSGTGVMLRLLRNATIEAVGVDIDESLVEKCVAEGLHVEQGAALEFLVRQGNSSCGGIFMGHIIEHFSGIEGLQLLYQCGRVLMPGGVIIILTPNYEHPGVGLKNFWLDITHQRPYPLPLLDHIFKTMGLRVLDKGLYDDVEANSYGANEYIVGELPLTTDRT